MRETFRFFDGRRSNLNKVVWKKITFKFQIYGAPVYYGIDVRARAGETVNLD